MTTKFWRRCPVCRGHGDIPSIDSRASKKPMTGDIVAVKNRSICGSCHGCGIEWDDVRRGS